MPSLKIIIATSLLLLIFATAASTYRLPKTNPILQKAAIYGMTGSETIGIYYDEANYTISPSGVLIGSHSDLAEPMNVMNWYTVSCGIEYNITGTLISYNYGTNYVGTGSVAVYVNATLDRMISGNRILLFDSTSQFSSLFSAC
jgi:hypothetical protein